MFCPWTNGPTKPLFACWPVGNPINLQESIFQSNQRSDQVRDIASFEKLGKIYSNSLKCLSFVLESKYFLAFHQRAYILFLDILRSLENLGMCKLLGVAISVILHSELGNKTGVGCNITCVVSLARGQFLQHELIPRGEVWPLGMKLAPRVSFSS
jgi:hypothetical protein